MGVHPLLPPRKGCFALQLYAGVVFKIHVFPFSDVYTPEKKSLSLSIFSSVY
jgi:hypothetical protein